MSVCACMQAVLLSEKLDHQLETLEEEEQQASSR